MFKVSVVMSCYNESNTISRAIRSILNQSFQDFEFIIIDDGSTDNTLEIIKKFSITDSRIVIIKNRNNIGLPASLNKGIHKARGNYIARMDADDVSLLERLGAQVEYLENNPNVDALGTNVFLISGANEKMSNLPLTNESIYRNRFKMTFLIHPTVMVRKEVFSIHGGYNEDLPWAEDKDLWLRWMASSKLLDGVTFANLEEPLLKYKVKEKINAKIFFYNHKVLITNMHRRGELLTNFHNLVRSVISHIFKMVKG